MTVLLELDSSDLRASVNGRPTAALGRLIRKIDANVAAISTGATMV
jgi:hypothetical protein